MKYTWTAASDDKVWNDKATRLFDTQEDCYADMMDHAVNKMKWNVDWEDVVEGQNIIENGGLKKTNEVGKYAGYIGYDVKFMPHKIVHTSYSGTYTYEIVTVADEGEKPVEKREERLDNEYTLNDEVVYDGIVCTVEDFRYDEEKSQWLYDLYAKNSDDVFNDTPQDKISVTKKDAESTRNKYSMCDEVEHNGVIYIVQDYHYDMDADGWVYDLKELEGDGEVRDIPQDEIKIYIEDIPESIIVEYEISGKPRMYVYNLTDINDCEHFFDDEDCIVRTLVKTDKGMSEEDYYRDMPIAVVKKWVLAARQKLG
jgi:hypothetical protein